MLRKKYLVKPKTQWKFLIFLTVIMLVLAILCYYVFWDSLLKTPGMDQLSAGAVKYFKRTYTGGFLWMVFIFMVFVLIQSFFYSHRILGPLYFFENVMRKVSEGNLSVKIHWRKKDETKELAYLIGAAIEKTRSSVLDDREKIREAIKAIDEGETEKAKDILKKVTDWCQTEPSEMKKI